MITGQFLGAMGALWEYLGTRWGAGGGSEGFGLISSASLAASHSPDASMGVSSVARNM